MRLYVTLHNIFSSASSLLTLPFRFSRKKVIIISDQRISTIRIGWFTQFIAFFFVITFASFLSYLAGKNFNNQHIIKKREIQILNTNSLNADLKAYIETINSEISEFDKYLDYVKTKDGAINVKPSGNLDLSNKNTYKSSEIAILEKHSQDMLININNKVIDRINFLRSILVNTGLTTGNFYAIKKIEDDNSFLTNMNITTQDFRNQGGPLSVVSDDNSANKQTESTSSFKFNPLYIKQSLDKKVLYLLELERLVSKLPIGSPLSTDRRITSFFGKRIDPIKKIMAFHNGLDVVGVHLANVLSTAPGRIEYAGRKGAYGNVVIVDHGSGISTKYGHLDKVLVKKGDYVQKGSPIGVQGSTGRSTGEHLHYEVRYYNKPYNPLNFVNAVQNVQEK